MSLDFDWIGESISVDFVDKQLTAKPKTFYRFDICIFFFFIEIVSVCFNFSLLMNALQAM